MLDAFGAGEILLGIVGERTLTIGHIEDELTITKITDLAIGTFYTVIYEAGCVPGLRVEGVKEEKELDNFRNHVFSIIHISI